MKNLISALPILLCASIANAGAQNDLTCARSAEVYKKIVTHHHAYSLGGQKTPLEKWNELLRSPEFADKLLNNVLGGLDPEHIVFTVSKRQSLKHFVQKALAKPFSNEKDCEFYGQLLESYRREAKDFVTKLPPIEHFNLDGRIDVLADSLSKVDEENADLVRNRKTWPSTETERLQRFDLAVAFRYRLLQSQFTDGKVAKRVLLRASYMNVLKYVYDAIVEDIVPADFPDRFLKAGLITLDPYSDYAPSSSREDNRTDRSAEGKFYLGLGFSGQWLTHEGLLMQVVAPESPVVVAGLRPGDNIVAVNGKSLRGLSDDVRSAQFKCEEPGDKKLLKFLRDQTVSEVAVSCALIKHADLKPKTFDISSMLTNSGEDVLYIRIYEFADGVFAEIVDEMGRWLSGRRFKGYVVDVRANPGGHNIDSWDLSSIFVKGSMELRTLKANGTKEGEFSSMNDLPREYSFDLPLVVLTDDSTASAAEHFAGNLQDYNRAIVVSEKSQTYGKGSSFVPFYESDIGFPGLNLGTFTISNGFYYLPSGRSPQLDGIKPDLLVGSKPKPSIPLMKDLPSFLKTPEPISALPIRKWLSDDCRQGFLAKLEKSKVETKVGDHDLIISAGLNVLSSWIGSTDSCMNNPRPKVAEVQ